MARKSAAFALAATAMVGAQAQESNFGISLGTKVWLSEWTTWFNAVNENNDEVVTQRSSDTKAIVIPVLSMRYKDFIASFSGAVKTEHEFPRPGTTSKFKRKEQDLNLGYYLTPGLAATVGYKRFSQISSSSGNTIFEVAGPTIGLSATSNLAGGFSVYGALGLGPLKVKDSATDFKADYSLSEVGLAYTVGLGRFVRSITFTGGYRTQIVKAKDILVRDLDNVLPSARQHASDVTQGFTLGIVASF